MNSLRAPLGALQPRAIAARGLKPRVLGLYLDNVQCPLMGLVERLERRYDAILAEGLAFHQAQSPLAPVTVKGDRRRGRMPRRTGHNLLLRLATRKQDALRFLNDSAVPFTNNQAERDVRMMKVKQKISGGFRCQDGATDFAAIRSFISTAKKQGWNIIDALTRDPANLAKSLRLSCAIQPT